MRRQVESTVRDVLAERAHGVAPPTDWETRVVGAGRRRQRRRRLSVATAAVAAAAIVGVVASGGLASYIGLPIGPAGLNHGRDPRLPDTTPAELPLGSAAPAIPYAVGSGEASPDAGGDEVVVSSARWQTDGFVAALEQAGDGVVAVVQSGVPYELVYVDARGRPTTIAHGDIDSIAVSADGTRVAWSTAGSDTRSMKVTLAELPSAEFPEGRVLASKAGARWDYTRVAAFVGDKVLLDYDVHSLRDHPPARMWNPATGRTEELLGKTYANIVETGGPGAQVRGLDARQGVAILQTSQPCLRSLSLAHPSQPARWEVCEPDIRGARLSESGRVVAGIANDDGSWWGTPWDGVWIYDAKTGALLAERGFTEVEVGSVVWESADTLLISYVDLPHNRGIDNGEHLLRCSSDLKRCERVPVEEGIGYTALMSRQGNDPPVTNRLSD